MFVKSIAAERIHVGAMLQHTTPTGFDGETLVVGVPDAFHYRLLENQGAFLLERLTADLKSVVKRINFEIHEIPDRPAAGVETIVKEDPFEYMQARRKDNPVIRAIFDHFGGELVW